MNKNDRLTLLRVSLADSMDNLNCEYLLRFLDGLPEYHQFGSIEQLVIDLLGCADPAHDYTDESEWVLAQEIWAAVRPEVDPMVRITDDEVIVTDLNGIEEIRVPIPDWLLRLNAVIGFLSDSYGRPPFALELRCFLVNVWLPEFC